jgi:hypothetical protein
MPPTSHESPIQFEDGLKLQSIAGKNAVKTVSCEAGFDEAEVKSVEIDSPSAKTTTQRKRI